MANTIRAFETWRGRRKLLANPKPARERRREIEERLAVMAKQSGGLDGICEVAFTARFNDATSALCIQAEVEQGIPGAVAEVTKADPTVMRVQFEMKPDARAIAGIEAHLIHFTTLMGGPGAYWNEGETRPFSEGTTR